MTRWSINSRSPATSCWWRSSPIIPVSPVTLAAAAAARADVARRAVASLPCHPPTRSSWTTWWPLCVPPSPTSSVASSPTSWSSRVWSTPIWSCISSLVTVYLKAFVSVVKVSPTEWCILISSYGENPLYSSLAIGYMFVKNWKVDVSRNWIFFKYYKYDFFIFRNWEYIIWK